VVLEGGRDGGLGWLYVDRIGASCQERKEERGEEREDSTAPPTTPIT